MLDHYYVMFDCVKEAPSKLLWGIGNSRHLQLNGLACVFAASMSKSMAEPSHVFIITVYGGIG